MVDGHKLHWKHEHPTVVEIQQGDVVESLALREEFACGQKRVANCVGH